MADPFAKTQYAPSGPLPDEAAVTEDPALSSERSTAETGPRRIGGRYEILGLLGAGGMGNVYRARDLELGEVVALKMLRPEIVSNPAALARFRLEVKLARRVTHPHVARMFDIGEDGGAKFLTMELIEGEALSSLIRREGRLSPARAVEIARGVCEGLSAAHAASVVHRDLKPDNVLLGRDGRTVVTDFGIAQAAGPDHARVTSGMIGTPSYMSPEQVEGKSAGPAADLYALGVMLFEMVTGDLPWTGDSAFAVAAARVLRDPPDPMERRPGLPRELGAVISKLLSRSPEDRFASAEDVRDALRLVPLSAPSLPPKSAAPGMDQVLPPSGKCKKQIAVLPLRNAGPKEDDYVADGLTEDLIDELSMADGVRVRSRGMVARYASGEGDPRQIGRELDVQVVVDGTVRRIPAGVQLSLRLISVADGVQIWRRRFERPPEEILRVSTDAARAVAEAIAVDIAGSDHVAASPEAVELYLRARSLYMHFFGAETNQALGLLERARALAPEDPRILAAYAMAAARRWAKDPSIASTALEVAELAVASAPLLADSHVALGVVRYHQRREADAVRSVKRALLLSRGNAEAHDLLGRILAETRLGDAAERHLRAALMAEPNAQLARAMLARSCMLRGAWDEALAVIQAQGPGDAATAPVTGRYCLWRNDVELAKKTLESTTFELPLTKVLLDVVVHRRPPWQYAPKAADAGSRFYAFLSQIGAETAMFLGDVPRALDFLEQADGGGGVFDIAWMEGCPLFEEIRSHPRFLAVREHVGARAAEVEGAYLEAVAPAR